MRDSPTKKPVFIKITYNIFRKLKRDEIKIVLHFYDRNNKSKTFIEGGQKCN